MMVGESNVDGSRKCVEENKKVILKLFIVFLIIKPSSHL